MIIPLKNFITSREMRRLFWVCVFAPAYSYAWLLPFTEPDIFFTNTISMQAFVLVFAPLVSIFAFEGYVGLFLVTGIMFYLLDKKLTWNGIIPFSIIFPCFSFLIFPHFYLYLIALPFSVIAYLIVYRGRYGWFRAKEMKLIEVTEISTQELD